MSDDQGSDSKTCKADGVGGVDDAGKTSCCICLARTDANLMLIEKMQMLARKNEIPVEMMFSHALDEFIKDVEEGNRVFEI